MHFSYPCQDCGKGLHAAHACAYDEELNYLPCEACNCCDKCEHECWLDT